MDRVNFRGLWVYILYIESLAGILRRLGIGIRWDADTYLAFAFLSYFVAEPSAKAKSPRQ